MLSITRTVVEDIIAHAREEFPEECCGLLGGSGKKIRKGFRVPNAAGSSTEFSMGIEQLSAFEEMDMLSLKFMGIYHSHPLFPCDPSPTDLEKNRSFKGLFLIVSLQNFNQPVVKVFWLEEGRATEEEFQISE
jgi:proteasome lid subunit RPN8/RPN11